MPHVERAQRDPPTGRGASLEIVGRPSEPVRAGARFAIVVSTSAGGPRRGDSLALRITSPDGATRCQPPGADGRTMIELSSPAATGPHTWTLALEPQEAAPTRHPLAQASLTLDIAPHTASLAVWAVPDAVTCGMHFTVKVGASSTAGAVLAGQPVEIRDADGAPVASALLGAAPWPGTAGLLWAEVEVRAPAAPGMAAWSAVLAPAGLSLPHEATVATFSAPITTTPEHRVSVTLATAEGDPVADALVRLGPFRATTDADGHATLIAAPGTYEVVAWKAGFDIPTPTIDVAGSTRLTLSAVPVAEDDPDAHWRA